MTSHHHHHQHLLQEFSNNKEHNGQCNSNESTAYSSLYDDSSLTEYIQLHK